MPREGIELTAIYVCEFAAGFAFQKAVAGVVALFYDVVAERAVAAGALRENMAIY